MGTGGVSLLLPRLGKAHGMAYTLKQMPRSALIAQLAVKALAQAMLLRFAWLDVAPLGVVLLRPSQYGATGELGAIVTANAR